jgi:hypothetical protein
MPTDVMIEERLRSLETAVVEIQHRLETGITTSDWVERFTGAFKDEPAFAEVIAYGRAVREADRPHEGGEECSRFQR